ncbi:MAG: hypothetical protein ACRDJ9_31160 [Dehalococcoidia bacterium]
MAHLIRDKDKLIARVRRMVYEAVRVQLTRTSSARKRSSQRATIHS